MSLVAQISHHLNKNNQFSIAKGVDLSSQLCHAWFISQDRNHDEYFDAQRLIQVNHSHPVLQFAECCQPTIEQELQGIESLPDSSHPLWSLFSPEALEGEQQPQNVRQKIQQARTLTDLTLDQAVISNVAQQVLFTSNVLLGVPLEGDDVSHLDLGEEFHRVLHTAQRQPQEYWYDHPIPVGISAHENEILYGLDNLDKALAVEVERGNLNFDQKLTVVLSCSVTHSTLADIAKQYVEYEIQTHLDLKYIEVAVFGENECRAIRRAIFPQATDHLKGVFGVNGAYGRHYTFLKAIAPLWQKAINSQLKATFKIDLDQVFDQALLIRDSGKSAFEHFLHSNWGATATDSEGHRVFLGMLGGGLVNESDAHHGLFTPDVKEPNGQDYAKFEQLFCARWGQALSTQEEIISRQENFQRVHVTGGTNGVLIDSLYTYQPFTPTFIHRAEDQAFILSVLANPVDDQYLVYSHQPGLIMRHDKDAFAGRVMQVSEAGKVLGDIERVLLFSGYAQQHPLGVELLKQKLYPFTGTFISKTPVTLALLRFMLEGCYKDANYLDSGALRLIKCLDFCQNRLVDEVRSNQKGWSEYYSGLRDKVLSDEAKRLVGGCLVGSI